MSNRFDLLCEISARCRRNHVAALATVGWFAADAPLEALERLRDHLVETEAEWAPDGHLAAYAERWGRLPDGR